MSHNNCLTANFNKRILTISIVMLCCFFVNLGIIPAQTAITLSNGTLPSASAVGTIANNFDAMGVFMRNTQQKVFYALGNFWAVYSNDTYQVWSSSLDGVTWRRPEVTYDLYRVGASGGDCEFDGNQTVYAVVTRAFDANLYFRNGTLNTNGTITWGEINYQSFIQDVSSPSYPHAVLDSVNHNLWIACINDTWGNPTIVKVNTSNMSVDFTYTMTDQISEPMVAALGGEKMLFMSTSQRCNSTAQAWNGSEWLSRINVSSQPGGETGGQWDRSLLNIGEGSALFVYLHNDTEGIQHSWLVYEIYNFTSNSFSEEQVVSSEKIFVAGYSEPVLSYDPTDDTVYCIIGGYGGSGVSTYTQYYNGVWSLQTILIDDTAFSNWTAVYDNSANRVVRDGILCYWWVNGTSSDNYENTGIGMPVRFAYFNLSKSYQILPTVSPSVYPTTVNSPSPINKSGQDDSNLNTNQVTPTPTDNYSNPPDKPSPIPTTPDVPIFTISALIVFLSLLSIVNLVLFHFKKRVGST